MTRHYMLSVKLFNLDLNKLKSAIKNGIEVTLNFSLYLIRNSKN